MENSNNNWAVRFFTLWTGQALSLLGSQLVQFAIIWHLTKTTNSATTLAIASMMGLLPQVLLSPFIGTWVDRGNRRLILMFADGTVAFATLILALLFALGFVQVWHIYLVLLVRAVAGGFHQSAFGASVVLLVPKDQLARVQGFNQALYGGMSIISAPLGAFLLAILPMQGILGIDISTALIAICIVFFTQIPQPERGESAAFTFWQDFAAGYRYIITWRGLVILLVLAMVINFFYSAIEPLTPLLITNHFDGGAANLVCGYPCLRLALWRADDSRRMGRFQTQDHYRPDRINFDGSADDWHRSYSIKYVFSRLDRQYVDWIMSSDHQRLDWRNVTGKYRT